ncbi:MAG: phosphotransferase [Actinomycetaceae bacterium]|nr:phosphotransferase [Actinomycetaceae bacterium]
MKERSLFHLAALAAGAVAGLNIVALRPPQSTSKDYQTTGLLDDQGRKWLVVAPLHDIAARAMDTEVSFIRQLATYRDAHGISFDVPRPQGYSSLPEGKRAMVYRSLPGDTLDLSTLEPSSPLTADLGRTISSLHELPPSFIENLGMPSYSSEETRQDLMSKLDEAAATGSVPPALLQRWEEALEESSWWRFKTVTIHSQLRSDSLFVTDNHVVGMTDFNKAQIGDPAKDLAWLVSEAPEGLTERVFEAYHLARHDGADPYLQKRAELYGELALLDWLLHGVQTKDATIIADAQSMLEDLFAHIGDASFVGIERDTSVTVESFERTIAEGEEHADDAAHTNDVVEDGDNDATQEIAVPLGETNPAN